MVEKNNRSDGDVHLENPPKPKRPLKNPPKPPKTHPKPPKLREKTQNLQKPSKTPKNLKIIQTSLNNRSRWFGKIIATMAMVGNVKK